MKEAVVEAKALTTFHFDDERFRRHNPLNIVSRHCHACKYRWPYQKEVWHEEEIYRRASSLDEVPNGQQQQSGQGQTKEEMEERLEKKNRDREAIAVEA